MTLTASVYVSMYVCMYVYNYAFAMYVPKKNLNRHISLNKIRFLNTSGKLKICKVALPKLKTQNKFKCPIP